MIDFDTKQMYHRVAAAYTRVISAAFESEETLQALFAKYFSALPFDRTSHWDTILRGELREAWKREGPAVKSSMTVFDENHILWHLASQLDYNLFTQVVTNVQPAGMISYRVGDAEHALSNLQERWNGRSPSPFDKKAKMYKTASPNENLSIEQNDFNLDLSKIKALKIITGITNARSFRVTPKGQTPALTDSENLSMLGIGGDIYLSVPPGMNPYYFTWEVPAQITVEQAGSDAATKWLAEGIWYPFVSKSGGDILNSVLFARRVAKMIYVGLSPETPKAILPRMGSVLLVSKPTPQELGDIETALKAEFGDLVQFKEGGRG